MGLGKGLHHLLAGGIAETNNLVVHLLARRAGDPHGFRKLLGGDDAFGDENLRKRVGHAVGQRVRDEEAGIRQGGQVAG